MSNTVFGSIDGMSNSGKPVDSQYAEFSAELRKQVDIAGATTVLERWLDEGPAQPVRRPQNGSKAHSDVGIWRPAIENGQTWFVRDSSAPQSSFWAHTPKIAPKNGDLRIVLIGESAANGFPFSPLFSCASALQQFLDAIPEGRPVEVIDITRSGLAFQPLCEIVNSARQLQPDAYVVFAGNNWGLSDLQNVNLRTIAELLRARGKWIDVATHIQGLLRDQIRWLLRMLGDVSKKEAVPVVLVIPEFNLLDWATHPSWCNPLVTGANKTRWLQSCALARAALHAGDVEGAQRYALEVIKIEDGISAQGFEILGQCALKQGATAKARRLLERARDIRFVLPIAAHHIACNSTCQREMRTAGPLEGLAVVDLPKSFAEISDGALPGRNFFVDSVHMTPFGMRAAMASVLASILPSLGKTARSLSQLMDIAVDVPSAAIAQGHFAAAVINSRNPGDRGDQLIRHHCSQALRATPHAVRLIDHYIDFRTRRPPVFLCRSFREFDTAITEMGGFGRHIFIPAPGQQKELDIRLIRILLDEVGVTRPGMNERTWSDRSGTRSSKSCLLSLVTLRTWLHFEPRCLSALLFTGD
jgi:hypothetical protein